MDNEFHSKWQVYHGNCYKQLQNVTYAKDRLLMHMLSNTVYNLGHNISELYNVLIKVRLNTSKMKRDI